MQQCSYKISLSNQISRPNSLASYIKITPGTVLFNVGLFPLTSADYCGFTVPFLRVTIFLGFSPYFRNMYVFLSLISFRTLTL